MHAPHFNASVVPITLGQPAGVKSVRVLHYFASLPIVLLIAGCAAVGVGLQADGRYILERNEQSADCQALHKNISARIQLLKELPAKARAEQSTAPPTASSLFGRLFGGPHRGLDAVAQYDRERSHVSALQRAMVEKKCIEIHVDTELAEADAEMARIRSN